MKLGLFAFGVLAMTGCASQPMTPYQQQLMLQQARRAAYQLPQPSPLAPVVSRPTNVHCDTYGNQTDCQAY